MDWFYKLFGNDIKVKFFVETYDGREGPGSIRIQSFNMNRDEIKKELINEIEKEKDVFVKKLDILSCENI